MKKPLVTLKLPTTPVTEDQLLVLVDGAQYGIASQQGPDWVLFSLSIHEEGRFPSIYDLLRHVIEVTAHD